MQAKRSLRTNTDAKSMKIIFTNTEHFRLIPDSALLLKNKPLFCPDYAKSLHAKVALVVKINRLGKYIQEKFAETYYDEIGFAINFYNKDCLNTLIQKGFPWERATCFDGSFALSEFMKISEIPNDTDVGAYCIRPTDEGVRNRSTQGVCNTLLQVFNINQTLQKIPSVISELSACMTLKVGDYIAIEIGELPLAPFTINDVLQLSLKDREVVRVVLK